MKKKPRSKLDQPESIVFLKEMRKRLHPPQRGGRGGSEHEWNSLSATARACKVDPAVLSLYMAGKRQPMLWVAIRIANYLKMDLKEIQEMCK